MICRIFAGGELGNIQKPTDGFIICADSGYRHAKALGIKPNIIVGDFDSYSGELPDDCEIHRSVPEKDDTDTLLAVKIAIERGYDRIFLYGAMGGSRFDHAFANIQIMLYAREHCAELILLGNERIALQGAGICRYPKADGDAYFSVFAITENVRIKSMSGVKYTLKNYEMKPSFPIGVSNEIIESEAVLEIESGIAIIIQS